MRTVDHKLLAKLIIKKYMKDIPDKYKKAFYLGCIEPDYNPLSYFHGFFRAFNLYGHNFSNVRYFLDKLIKKLNNDKKYSLYFFYRLGILTHYVTDAFTHAHTVSFSGTLTEHRRYEQKLHIALNKLSENSSINFTSKLLSFNNIKELSKLHNIYINSDISVFNDITFIFSLIGSIMDNFLPMIQTKKFNINNILN